MKKHHQVEKIEFVEGMIKFEIDGIAYSFALSELSSILAGAKKSDLEIYEISPSGYGIHWPLLDEDLSIDGMLGISHLPKPTRKSVSL